MAAARVRFGPFEFDPTTGEVTRREPGESSRSSRLPPQPARLLALFLDRYPSIVTREEIRAAIWPDVTVDFERGLHFCVRQVRQALGESAAEPTYIETIPRRGYRWLVEPAAAPAPIAALSSAESSAHRIGGSSRGRGRLTLGLLTAVALVALGWWIGLRDRPGDGAMAAPRIAVMPMQPASALDERFAGNGLAESILEALMRPGLPPLEVIGPTTTVHYVHRARPLRDLIGDLDIDYVLNGRFSPDEEGRPRMLAEVVRATDGAHVWVKSYTDISRHGSIAREFVTALLERLEEPPTL